MKPWETLDTATAPDGEALDLRRRGHEFLIRAGGYDLMSSEDDGSSKALASLGLGALGRPASRVLVGGLGMGFTLREALDREDGRQRPHQPGPTVQQHAQGDLGRDRRRRSDQERRKPPQPRSPFRHAASRTRPTRIE